MSTRKLKLQENLHLLFKPLEKTLCGKIFKYYRSKIKLCSRHSWLNSKLNKERTIITKDKELLTGPSILNKAQVMVYSSKGNPKRRNAEEIVEKKTSRLQSLDHHLDLIFHQGLEDHQMEDPPIQIILHQGPLPKDRYHHPQVVNLQTFQWVQFEEMMVENRQRHQTGIETQE